MSVRKLVGLGLDLSISTANFGSVLHQLVLATFDRSAESGYRANPERYSVALRLTEFFIGFGVSPELTDGQGTTPLAYLLTDRGMAAYINQKNVPDYFSLAYLLATQEAVSVIDDVGHTSLMILISALHKETELDLQFVKHLINQGVNLNARDDSGKTAYELAMEKNLLNIAWEIEQHSAAH